VIGRIVWGYLADRFLAPPVMLGCIAMLWATASVLTALLAPGPAAACLVRAVRLRRRRLERCLSGRGGAPDAGRAGEHGDGRLAGHHLSRRHAGRPIFGLITEWSGSYGLSFVVTTLPLALRAIALFGARHMFGKSK
jgi:hypothetical protein